MKRMNNDKKVSQLMLNSCKNANSYDTIEDSFFTVGGGKG